MEILVLPNPEGRVIGRELQMGKAEGEFILEPDGTVVYRSPYDEKAWYAAPSAEAFHQSAECWRRYRDHVRSARSGSDEADAVAKLRAELERLALLKPDGSSFWSSIVEQTEHGLL
jgi:hypothetical protein